MKNYFNRIIIVGATVSCMLIQSCYYDTEQILYPANNNNQCDTTGAIYSQKVTDIIGANCLSCHSVAEAQGSVILEGYSNLKTYVDNGKLMGTIKQSNGFSMMPKGGNKLNACDISILQAWINQGSTNN